MRWTEEACSQEYRGELRIFREVDVGEVGLELLKQLLGKTMCWMVFVGQTRLQRSVNFLKLKVLKPTNNKLKDQVHFCTLIVGNSLWMVLAVSALSSVNIFTRGLIMVTKSSRSSTS